MEVYSIITDFGGSRPNPSQLHEEIINEVGITKTLIGVTIYNDIVEIVFDINLTAPEKILLDAIVSSHIADNDPIPSKKLIVYPNSATYRNQTYKRIGSAIFPGSTYAIAKSISCMSSNATSYDIRIFDKTTHQVLLDVNLNNTEESIQDLGILSNLSINNSQLEVSVKINSTKSSSKVFMESVTLYYI